MTEQEWAETVNVPAMIDFLNGRFGLRKRRLFAAECCRQNWEMLRDPRERRVVETLEKLADGETTEKERAAAESGLFDVLNERDAKMGGDWNLMSILWTSLL